MRRAAIAYVIMAAAMLAALGWRIAVSEDRIRTGRKVRVEVRAYDPSDPLRGRYLALALPAFSPEAILEVEGPADGEDAVGTDRHGEAYASVRDGKGDFLELDGVSPYEPGSGEYLRLRRDADGLLLPPFDRFYLNQDEAAEADELLRGAGPEERAYVVAYLKDGALIPLELRAGGRRFRAGSE